MSSTDSYPYPKLRSVETTPVHQGGRTFIMLRDPLQLADKQIIIPREIAPILALCDGTRDSSAISAALAVRYGQHVSSIEIDHLLTALDDAHLLENERFLDAREKALLDYVQAPFRNPILSGVSYPSEKDALRETLNGYLAKVENVPKPTPTRGLVTPHIDYERGGHVYAQVWAGLSEAMQDADLAVILGTDHFGEDDPLTLTRQNYATPYGILPTATSAVDKLAKTLNNRIVFNGELYHKAEHSIELAAVWLHHMLDGKTIEILPILCGSFDRFIKEGDQPEDDFLLQRFIHTLKRITADHATIVVAAADLSHVGPAFGGRPLDFMGRARLKAADQELIDRMCAGDSKGFFESIRLVENRNNVCGVSPIFLTLQLLSQVEGQAVAYDLCPADQQGTSLVSICGVLFQ
jgi:AmmeMemoRadiSam system protein B